MLYEVITLERNEVLGQSDVWKALVDAFQRCQYGEANAFVVEAGLGIRRFVALACGLFNNSCHRFLAQVFFM